MEFNWTCNKTVEELSDVFTFVEGSTPSFSQNLYEQGAVFVPKEGDNSLNEIEIRFKPHRISRFTVYCDSKMSEVYLDGEYHGTIKSQSIAFTPNTSDAPVSIENITVDLSSSPKQCSSITFKFFRLQNKSKFTLYKIFLHGQEVATPVNKNTNSAPQLDNQMMNLLMAMNLSGTHSPSQNLASTVKGMVSSALEGSMNQHKQQTQSQQPLSEERVKAMIDAAINEVERKIEAKIDAALLKMQQMLEESAKK